MRAGKFPFPFLLLLCLLALPPRAARAADATPGSACAAANAFTRSAGPETSGVTDFMVCQGGTWKVILGADASGAITTIGNQTCASGDYLKFDGTKFICAGGGPAAFSFTDQTGVALSTTITSNTVTLSGFTGVLSATCTGCTAIARNGSWGGTTLAGFQPGDTIALRVTSSASLGTVVTASVTVGGTTSATWTVTTTSSSPSVFAFTDVTGATANITYTSDAVTLAGFTGTLTANCTGCIGIARNGNWTGGTMLSGFVSGDTIALRQNSAAGLGSSVQATVTLGATTSSPWTVTNTSGCQTGITVGQACPDGTIYAGISPDGSVPMYTTPCDAGQYWNGSACTACASGMWSGSGTACSTTWSSTNYPYWNNGTTNWTVTGYTSATTGRSNTAGLAALNDAGSPYDAASYCDGLTAYGDSDWYLPAKDELNVMYGNRTAIGNFDVTDGGTSIGGASPGLYWTSMELSNNSAWIQRFSDGTQFGNTKNNHYSIRCVRR